MSDPIGQLILFGDHAQKLFNKTTPGDTFTIRVKGTVQGMTIPARPVGQVGQPTPYGYNQLPTFVVEVEEVSP